MCSCYVGSWSALTVVLSFLLVWIISLKKVALAFCQRPSENCHGHPNTISNWPRRQGWRQFHSANGGLRTFIWYELASWHCEYFKELGGCLVASALTLFNYLETCFWGFWCLYCACSHG